MTKNRKGSALRLHELSGGRHPSRLPMSSQTKPAIVEDVARIATSQNAENWFAQVRAAELSGNMERVAALVQMLRANSMASHLGHSGSGDSLRHAIEAGDPEAIEPLLRAGVDLNATRDSFGMPPLIWAMSANRRSARIVGLLLAHGADAGFSSEEGYTPLHFVGAYPWGTEDLEELSAIVACLKSAGAALEARTHWGWTPLYRAVHEGSETEVEALLRNGADPNAGPSERAAPGYTRTEHILLAAGHQAAKLRLLLSFGADPRPIMGTFAVKAAQADLALAERRAKGKDARYEEEVVEGYEASMALMRGALARH